MQVSELQAHIPHRLFLVQGGEVSFSHTLHSILEYTPFAHSLIAPRFTVEHAQEIVTFINEGNGEERFYIAYFTIFSPEAAEILLKSLEEPDPFTTVVFITEHPYLVPATVRSRVVLRVGSESLPTTQHFSSQQQALDYIKTEFDADTEDAAVRRAKAVIFLDSIEQHIRKNPVAAETLYNAKHMLFRGNLPTKYILEYVVHLVL